MQIFWFFEVLKDICVSLMGGQEVQRFNLFFHDQSHSLRFSCCIVIVLWHNLSWCICCLICYQLEILIWNSCSVANLQHGRNGPRILREINFVKFSKSITTILNDRFSFWNKQNWQHCVFFSNLTNGLPSN